MHQAATSIGFVKDFRRKLSNDYYAKAKVVAPPKTFQELWPSRERKQIHAGEKHYWRSNERVHYTIYEDRAAECAIVVPSSVGSDTEFRTLFLSLPLLYSTVSQSSCCTSYARV